MNISDIKAVAVSLPTEIKAFRSAAVTSENRATPLARSMLAALVAGSTTPSLIEAAVITAFGNPKSPKSGKAIASLSATGDFLPGWGATRKTVGTIVTLFADIDADKPSEEGAVGAAAIRPLIVSFILSEPSAPKSLKALSDSIKAHIKAHAEAIMPPQTEEEKEELKQQMEDASPSTPAMSLTDRVNALIVAYQAADETERNEATAAIEAFMDIVMAVAEPEAGEPELQEAA